MRFARTAASAAVAAASAFFAAAPGARCEVGSAVLSKVGTDAAAIGRELSSSETGTSCAGESKVSLGASLSSGNSESGGAPGRVDLRRAVGRWGVRFWAAGAYEEQRLEESATGRKYDERTVGNSKAALHLQRRLDGWYVFTAGSAANDDIARVRYRAVQTVGAGMYLADWRGFRASVESGPAAIQEKLGDERNSFRGLRAAQRLEWKPEPDSFRLWQEIEAIWDALEPGRAIYSGEFGAEAPLAGGFSLVAKAAADYDSDPADGAEKADCKLSAMLAYTF